MLFRSEVTFSTPNFTTKKNTAVRASIKGKRVTLRFKVTKAQLRKSKNKVTIYGGSKKVKKLVTVRAKAGTNTVTVKNVGKGGYVVKAGKTVIGSATLGQNSGGGKGGSSGSKTATVGSNYSDAVPKAAFAAMVSGFQTKSGDTLKVNTVPHNDFQNNINNYLQGSPDDVFTWFAGFRMRYYAKKGLVAQIRRAHV